MIEALTGTWSVRRWLRDRRSGECGEFVGTASFVPDGADTPEQRQAGTEQIFDALGDALKAPAGT